MTLTFRDLKNSYRIFKDEYNYLSPLHGFLWLKSGLAEKYYNFSSKESFSGKLIRSLFYQNKAVEFNYTSNIKQLSYYFSVNTISKIILNVNFIKRMNVDDIKTNYSSLKNNLINTIMIDEDFLKKLSFQNENFAIFKKSSDIILKFSEYFNKNEEKLENFLTQKKHKIEKYKSLLNALNRKIELEIPDKLREKLAIIRDKIKELPHRQKTGLLSGGELKEAIKSNHEILFKINTLESEKKILNEKILISTPASLLKELEDIKQLIENENKIIVDLQKEIERERINFPKNIFMLLDKNNISKDFQKNNIPITKYDRYIDYKIKNALDKKNPEIDSILTEDLTNFVENLLNSIIEDAGVISDSESDSYFYEGFTTFNILLTLLWSKSSSKKCLIGYIKYLLDNDKNYFKNIYLHLIYNKESQEIWEQDSFNINDVANEESYEDYVYGVFEKRMYNSYFPELAITAVSSPTETDRNTFPDCAESSLRNFLNILLKDYNTKKFNASLLENLPYRVSSQVIDFYKTYWSLESVSDQKTHNAWAKIISNLNAANEKPFVKYLKPYLNPYYELSAGGRNILNVLKKIIGTDDIQSFVNSICHQTKRNIVCNFNNFYPDNSNIPDYENKITFIFEDKYIFEWYFLKEHVRSKTIECENKSQEIFSSFQNFASYINGHSSHKNALFNLIAFVYKKENIEKLKNEINTDKLNSFEQYYMHLLTNLDSVELMHETIISVLENSKFVKNSNIMLSLKEIMVRMPIDEFHAPKRKKYTELINQKKISELFTITNILNNEVIADE